MGYSLLLKTVQGNAFKLLTEALKEILTEANIQCDSTGLKIIEMDSSHTILVHLKLDADKFEHYECNEKQVFGISMLNFYKLIKTIGNNDTLTLFVEDTNKSELGIKIENSENNTETTFGLNLLDLNMKTIQIPKTAFKNIMTLPSNLFQKICRDMSQLSEIIEIKSVNNKLICFCKGDFASQETVLGETTNGMTYVINEDPDDIVQGNYSLKSLFLFTKCTNLCNTIKLYIKNDYPLIIEYSCANLGIIRLCLAPKTENAL